MFIYRIKIYHEVSFKLFLLITQLNNKNVEFCRRLYKWYGQIKTNILEEASRGHEASVRSPHVGIGHHVCLCLISDLNNVTY